MALDLSADEELVTLELDLDDNYMFVINLIINEGRRREREEIVEALMGKYDESCCCDTARFGEHYLAHKQPDNLINLINQRRIG